MIWAQYSTVSTSGKASLQGSMLEWARGSDDCELDPLYELTTAQRSLTHQVDFWDCGG